MVDVAYFCADMYIKNVEICSFVYMYVDDGNLVRCVDYSVLLV